MTCLRGPRGEIYYARRKNGSYLLTQTPSPLAHTHADAHAPACRPESHINISLLYAHSQYVWRGVDVLGLIRCVIALAFVSASVNGSSNFVALDACRTVSRDHRELLVTCQCRANLSLRAFFTHPRLVRVYHLASDPPININLPTCEMRISVLHYISEIHRRGDAKCTRLISTALTRKALPIPRLGPLSVVTPSY